jgi:hypothetical protein
MSISIDARILVNSYTTSEWTSSNPVLPDRVLAYDTTVRKFKLGDGATHWVDLPYWGGDSIGVKNQVTVLATGGDGQNITVPTGYTAYCVTVVQNGQFQDGLVTIVDNAHLTVNTFGTNVILTFF